MKQRQMKQSSPRLALALVLLLALAACSSAPKKDLALEQVRSQLNELKSDEELAGYAPLAAGRSGSVHCARLKQPPATRNAFT